MTSPADLHRYQRDVIDAARDAQHRPAEASRVSEVSSDTRWARPSGRSDMSEVHYTVAVAREGNVWTAVVEGLPGGATEVERLAELHDAAYDLIATLTGTDPGSFTIDWKLPTSVALPWFWQDTAWAGPHRVDDMVIIFTGQVALGSGLIGRITDVTAAGLTLLPRDNHAPLWLPATGITAISAVAP